MRFSLISLIILLVLLLFTEIGAKGNKEPLADKLRETFQKPYLSLGFVLQVVGDIQPERSLSGNNGFNISNMRISLNGELDRQFGYMLQTNFINSPAVLDAKLYLRLNQNTTLQAGLFKAPFSKEFLVAAESIDMVNRSQVVSQLVPGRQIGMQLGIKNDVLEVDAGLFNGNGYGDNGNDNNDLMVVGRLTVSPQLENAKLEAGLNGAISNDRNVRVAGDRFRGQRMLLGGDIRFEQNKLLLAGEYIYAALDSSGPAAQEVNPRGFHVTAGYMVIPDHQFLLRWDQFDADKRDTVSKYLIFGYNYWPTSLTELQLNYLIDTDQSEFNAHQLLINVQVAF